MQLDRRQFIKGMTLAGGGLALGVQLSGCDGPALPHARQGDFQPNAFLQISPGDGIAFYLHKAEMGQGVHTGMATLLAEELDIDPARLQMRHAEVHPDFRDPEFRLMTTGGSTSIKNSYDMLREAGATARTMLVAAAAAEWNVDAASLRTEDGEVIDPASGRRVAYTELANRAATLSVPRRVKLKDPAEFRYIGRYDRRLDAPAKVAGEALFGIDLPVPEGGAVAVLVRCPHFGGRPRNYEARETLASPGVIEVLELPHGIAVLADTYWHARKASERLRITWDKGPLAGLDSAAILAEQRRQMSEGKAARITRDGSDPGDRGELIEAEYYAPYLAHAALEPQNAIADVREDRVDIWCGNQGPDSLQDAVARELGLKREQVHIHNALLGGGFGRRIMPDTAVEAALISRQAGRPVKLVWSREDDTRHDYYRPSALARLRARVEDGRIIAWDNRLVSPSLARPLLSLFMKSAMPAWLPGGIPDRVGGWVANKDPFASEGASHLPYDTGYLHVDYIDYDPGIPIGFWRSVGHSYNGFFVEAFMDELAAAAGEDPLSFRLRHMPADSRDRRVLEAAAQKAGWGQVAEGRFQGLAVHESFGSSVAQVVEVSRSNGRLHVERVVCAIECGRVVNPDIVVMQMESGVNFALSAALYGEITIEDGCVMESNFHDEPLLRLHEAPRVEVVLLPSDDHPSGVGEPGVPPLAAALANAIHAATGQRQRQLPLRLDA